MADSGRKLHELRVIDLKDELEKRHIDTLGPKSVLVQRLEKAMKEEELDPSTHIFVAGVKPIKKGDNADIKIKEEIVDTEDVEIANEEGNSEEENNIVDQQIDDVDTKTEINNENDDNNESKEAKDWGEEGDEVDQIGDVDDECIVIEDEDQNAVFGDAVAPNVVDEDIKVDQHNLDNEESLNLSIGEDEKMLLIEEEREEKAKTTDRVENKKDDKGQSGKSSSDKDEKKSSRSGKEDSKSNGKDDTKSNRKAEESKKDGENGSDTKNTSSKSSAASKEQKEKSSSSTVNQTSTSSTNNSSAAVSTTTSSKSATNASSSNSNNNGSSTKSSSTSATTSRNLWVSGLSSLTRASDLKTIFTKYGKVIGAKVVTNTRTPGTRCYGYVTMASSSDATRCIDQLHHTELHGRIISVERTKNELGSGSTPSKASGGAVNNNTTNGGKNISTTGGTGTSKNSTSRASSKKKDDDKKTGNSSSLAAKDGAGAGPNDRTRHRSRTDDKHKPVAAPHAGGAGAPNAHVNRNIGDRIQRRIDNRRAFHPRRDFDREREERVRERERQRQREMLNYQKIREERERQRLRERERELREEDRRRREIRERQREEEQRLAAERRKLAMERERLEREKGELIRLERERQKLEREKLELERLELKRQQMKIIQAREEPPKRSVAKRSSVDRYADVPDRKRSTANESRFEAPPPPRFDTGLVAPRSYEKKREDYVSSSSAGKRNVDDYASTSKRLDYASGGSKRSTIDDYAGVPTKRSYDDVTTKRSLSTSKRNIDDQYSSSSKRDDYSSKSARDEYKREVEIRHIPSDRASGSSYKRSAGIEDIRNTSSSKRYDNNSAYGGGSSSNNGVWNSSGHMNHTNGSSGGGGGGGVPVLKPYVSNNMHGSNTWTKTIGVEESNWRQVPSTQDRYDRNYSERSGGGSGGMYGSSGGRPAQDRYGGPVSSRY